MDRREEVRESRERKSKPSRRIKTNVLALSWMHNPPGFFSIETPINIGTPVVGRSVLYLRCRIQDYFKFYLSCIV
ncbi:MAG: hypothetical protein ACTSSA_07045 [Candidatus Freyarchaeota archaeon]